MFEIPCLLYSPTKKKSQIKILARMGCPRNFAINDICLMSIESAQRTANYNNVMIILVNTTVLIYFAYYNTTCFGPPQVCLEVKSYKVHAGKGGGAEISLCGKLSMDCIR